MLEANNINFNSIKTTKLIPKDTWCQWNITSAALFNATFSFAETINYNLKIQIRKAGQVQDLDRRYLASSSQSDVQAILVNFRSLNPMQLAELNFQITTAFNLPFIPTPIQNTTEPFASEQITEPVEDE